MFDGSGFWNNVRNNSQQLLAMGGGLLSGRTGPEQWGNGISAYAQSIGDNRRRTAEMQKQNMTLNWLKQNAPEYAAAVEAGVVSPGDAFKMHREAKMPKDTRFSTQPELFETPDGEKVFGTFGSDGTFKRIDTGDLNPISGVDKMDMGTHYTLIDKKTGAVIGTMPKENYQEKFDQARGTEEGKSAAERPAMRSKAVSAMSALDSQRSVVNGEIGRAIAEIQQSPTLTTGLVGGLSSAIPGTPAYALAKKLETIKANVGFDKLQSMRENSPTGGALGQVSDFENRQLQAVFGSLDQAQTAEDIIFNLRRLEQILAESRSARQMAFERDFGASGADMPTIPQSAPQPSGNGGVQSYKDYF